MRAFIVLDRVSDTRWCNGHGLCEFIVQVVDEMELESLFRDSLWRFFYFVSCAFGNFYFERLDFGVNSSDVTS